LLLGTQGIPSLVQIPQSEWDSLNENAGGCLFSGTLEYYRFSIAMTMERGVSLRLEGMVDVGFDRDWS